jgi:hypothetical protein
VNTIQFPDMSSHNVEKQQPHAQQMIYFGKSVTDIRAPTGKGLDAPGSAQQEQPPRSPTATTGQIPIPARKKSETVTTPTNSGGLYESQPKWM